MLAQHELKVSVDRLDTLVPAGEVAAYTPVARFTRMRLSGDKRWKTYGAIYEHPWRKDALVEIQAIAAIA